MLIHHFITSFLAVTFLVHSQLNSMDFYKDINRAFQVDCVRYSPDGVYLAATQRMLGITIAYTSNYSYIHNNNLDFTTSTDSAYAMAYSNDQNMIAYCVSNMDTTPGTSKIRIVNSTNLQHLIKTIPLNIN